MSVFLWCVAKMIALGLAHIAAVALLVCIIVASEDELRNRDRMLTTGRACTLRAWIIASGFMLGLLFVWLAALLIRAGA